jgi:hypothetical protein
MSREGLPVAEFAFPGPLRDQLVAAILSGGKTTTTGLLAGYERDGEPLPRPGSRQAVGGKLVAAGYPFGEYDAVVLFEAPDDATAAGFALAIAAGGAARSAKTTRLLSGQEWIESLRKAQGSLYRPPQ